MLLSEARPRPYRQHKSERGFDQKETDKKYFDELRDHAVWTKNYGQDFIDKYKHAFDKSDAVARNPRSTIRSYCRNIIRDAFIPYYKLHSYKFVKDPDMYISPTYAYHDSVHLGVAVNAEVDVHRPLDKDIWQNVGEFTVRGRAGESVVSIEKDPYTGRDVSDALFSIMRSEVGPQYEKVLKSLEMFAYDDNGRDGFDYERDYIQDDPEVRKLLDMMCAEVDKQVVPMIEATRKKLETLRVYVSQHVRDLYKSK